MNHYVLVCGGRDYEDEMHLNTILRTLAVLHGEDLRIMHGAAPGADTLADEWAKRQGVKCKPFPADWDKHGRAAGPIRNLEMLKYLKMCRRKGHGTQVIAFDGGSGTAHMCGIAEDEEFNVSRV